MNRIPNPNDRVGPEARSKNLHVRWHTKRGLVNPSCKFCLLEQPAKVEEVLTTPTVQEVKQKSYDDQLFYGRVKELAAVGCPVETAARVLDMDVRVFAGLAENHFQKSWITLQQECRLTTLVDLQVEAVKQVRKGRDKLILVLDKHGLMPQLGELREQARGELDSTSMLPKDLADRVREMLETLKERKPYTTTATLSLEERGTNDGLIVGKRTSHEQDEYDLPISSTPRPSEEPEIIPETEVIPEPTPVIAVTDKPRAPQVPGGAIARPKSGVQIKEDFVRAIETSGQVKREMLELIR